MTQDDPWVTQDDPRVTQDDPRTTQEDPRVILNIVGIFFPFKVDMKYNIYKEVGTIQRAMFWPGQR